MEAGISEGRKPELMGGGLIRSPGGWEEVKKIRDQGHDRIKSDERILGDSGFAMEILAQAEERLRRDCELKARGYGFEHLEQRFLILRARILHAEQEEPPG